MTASPPDSPSGEVWTSALPSFNGDDEQSWWMKGSECAAFVANAGVARELFIDKGLWQRSVLPIPSAERIAALEALALAVVARREAIDLLADACRDVSPGSDAGRSAANCYHDADHAETVALERLKGCER